MRRLSRSPESLKDHYEVVVIGSGYGGAIAASRFARAGRQVCLLERGREFQPGEYPNTEFDGVREIQYNAPEAHLGSRLGLFDLHLNQDINALVGCGLGGTSLINASVALEPDPRVWQDVLWPRALINDLDTRLKAGYAHAVDMLRPTPLPVDFPHLPKLEALQKSAAGLGMQASFSRPPINVNFVSGTNHVGVEQQACVGCGDCSSGCNYGAKNTTLMNYLPDAAAHGAEIYTGINVRALTRRADKWIIDYQLVAVGREAFDAPELFITADLVIVSAGTLGSTEILLRSKSRGLSLSDRIGERFTGNGDVLAFGYNTDTTINGIGFGAHAPGAIPPVGPCITGLIDHRNTANLRDGFVIEEGSIPGALGAIMPGLFSVAAETIGKRTESGPLEWLHEREREATTLLRGPYHGATANTQTYLVMAHDDANGRMSLENDRLRIAWPGVGSEPIFKTVNDTLTKATQALGGGVEVPNPLWSQAIGKKLITVHPLGGCGMAEQAEHGVVDHAGRVFAAQSGTQVYEGLYVADGSIVPTSLGVNPLLTISALAERTCMMIAEERGWTIDYGLGALAQPLEHTRIGLRFTETMSGTFQSEDGACAPMRFTVTVVSEDLDALLDEASHPASITGTLICPALSADPLSVTEGSFGLFVDDPQHIDTRLMTYTMLLRSTDGKAFEFHGVKTIHDSPAYDAWQQTTTLAVTVKNAGADHGEPVGSAVLKIEAPDFLTQLRTMDVTNAPDTSARLKALARFGETFAGVMWDAYGGVFARESEFDPDAPPRKKRALRVDPPEVHPVRTADGVTLRLTRYRGGDKGPVLLLHGAGVSSRIFSTDLIDTNLLEYLFAHGYDCWLGDFRVSIDLESAALPSNADQIARFDHPALIAHVCRLTGASDVQVVAHCYGATTFTMALLRGLPRVRSVVLSQISAHMKAPALSEIKAGLHLPEIVNALGVDSLTAYTDRHDDWKQAIFDDALRLYPIRHDEHCRSAVCHRISFLYAQLYNHSNLSPLFHDNLHELFGVCSVETFEHLARMMRVGHVVAFDGAEVYLPHLDRMNMPIAFLHGADNRCFLPESTETTYDALCKRNDPSLYSRTVIEGYGHIDCIFGRNAVVDVFPHILAHLEKTAIVPPRPTLPALTYRDHFLSLYQSAIDETVRKRQETRGFSLSSPSDGGLALAAAKVAELYAAGVVVIPDDAPAGIAPDDWLQAKRAFELMRASVNDETSLIEDLKQKLDFGTDDPRWAETIVRYLEHFKCGRDRTIPYISPSAVGDRVVTLKEGATIALIGDWGTGTPIAANVLGQAAAHRPDVVIHLGDIYYSGTPNECQHNFRSVVDTVLNRSETHLPVYTLSGNHDMYCGGIGYYPLIRALNDPPFDQPASFFCLRTPDQCWQILAMDTGLSDFDPLQKGTVLPSLNAEEIAWHEARIREFPGKTILLSHHQLFSAFSQIGPPDEDGVFTAFNPLLAQAYGRFAAVARQPIAAWFWGHEHNLCVYDQYRDFAPGRCIGYSAVPVFASESPYLVPPHLLDPPTVVTRLGMEGDLYQHGFAIVRLGTDTRASVEYYETGSTAPVYTETL